MSKSFPNHRSLTPAR